MFCESPPPIGLNPPPIGLNPPPCPRAVNPAVAEAAEFAEAPPASPPALGLKNIS